MASNNDSSKPDQNANKPAAASDDFADVDWMIMSDLSAKIGGDTRSPQNKNQGQNQSSANFVSGKPSENKLIDDDDNEDLQWLQSLGLDEPIIQTQKSYEQPTSLISQQNGSQKSDDVGNIDWLIVTDLKTKIEDSGIKAKNLTTGLPSVEVAPAEVSHLLDDALENDLGLDSLSGLSFDNNADNADLSDLDTLGFSTADDDFSSDFSSDFPSNFSDDFSTDAIDDLNGLESDSLNLGLDGFDDDFDFESSLNAPDIADVSEWEQSASSPDSDRFLSDSSKTPLNELDEFDEFDQLEQLDQREDELPSSAFTDSPSWSSETVDNSLDDSLDIAEDVEESLSNSDDLANDLPDNLADLAPELQADYQDYYDNADMLDFDSVSSPDAFGLEAESQAPESQPPESQPPEINQSYAPVSSSLDAPMVEVGEQSHDFTDAFAMASMDAMSADALSADAMGTFDDLQSPFAHDSFGQIQDLVNSGIDVSSDEIWSSSGDMPAIALDNFDNFDNSVDEVFGSSWEDAANDIASDSQAIDDSVWHSDEVVEHSLPLGGDLNEDLSGDLGEDLNANIVDHGSSELETFNDNAFDNDNFDTVQPLAEIEDNSWQDDLGTLIGDEDIVTNDIDSNDIDDIDIASVNEFDSSEDLPPAWQLEAESSLENPHLEDLEQLDAVNVAVDDADWNPTPSIDLVNENITDSDMGWNTDIESVMGGESLINGIDNDLDAAYPDSSFSEPEIENKFNEFNKFNKFDEFNEFDDAEIQAQDQSAAGLEPEAFTTIGNKPDLSNGIAPPPPFPPAIAFPKSEDKFEDKPSNQFEHNPPFPPTPTAPPLRNSQQSSSLAIDTGGHDFLDDFDLDSIDPDITDGDFSEGFLPPSVATTLNPVPPPKPEPTVPSVSSPPPPPPFLPPLPPKRPANLDKAAMPLPPNPNPLPQTKARAAADDFEQFHAQPSQGRQPRGIDSVDQSWSELLDADTVLSGVLKSPATPPRSDTAGRPHVPNSAGRSLRDTSSSRNNAPKKKTTELSDFNDLGIDIHDDNTDWSGLLDSVDLSDSITSISEFRTELPPSGRSSQPNFAKDRTSISETREIPRDRRPVSGFNAPPPPSPMPQNPMSPPVVDFNRFTDDSYNGYGGGYDPLPATPAPSKPKMTMPSISIESLWQDYLKLPVIGLGVIGGLFLLYSVANRPIFDLGLRWGIFKDARGKDFSKADLRGAKLDNVDFSDAILTGAKMQNASLVGANLQGANLNGVNFTGANMSRARLVGATVVWSEFTDAQMNLVDFAGADITRSNFSGAKMDGANLKGAKIGAQGTEQATKLSPVTLLAWQIVNTPREGRNLSGQNLSGLNLSSSNLRRANLTNTRLNYTDMSKTDLSGANLSGSQVNGTNWSGAKLSGANLSGLRLDRTKLPRTDEATICPNNRPGPCKF